MRIIITILIILNSINMFGQRTTFENKMVIFAYLDSVEIDLIGIDVFTSENTFTLVKIEKNLFQIPNELWELKIDSFNLKIDNRIISIPGNLIRLYDENGIVRLYFNHTFDFECAEALKSKGGCLVDWVELKDSCETKLKVYSYTGSCLLKLHNKIFEDCLLKTEREIDKRTLQGGLPAQYENHINGR